MTTDMEKELEALGRFRMGKIIGGKWKIVLKLDEGGFGSVYKVQSLKDSKLCGALKIELSRPEEPNHLKLETEVLKDLHSDGFRSHIPTLYRSGKKKTYCYMIISLLGENLKRLKEKHFSKGMPLRTLSRVAIQALYAIKTMHDRGYVHRDIKPGNFVLGYPGIPAVARFVYIIDFGLARAFAYAPPKNAAGGGRWIARKARATLDFKGTWRFASPSMHEEKEQGRKDDLWSFLYMLIDLYCGLPWVDTDDRKVVEMKKLNMNDADLMTRMPEEFKFIPKHLRTLDVYQRPDYHRIFTAFDKVRSKCNVSFDDPYEWELREYATANKAALKRMQPAPGYTRADGYMIWDPLLITGAPSHKDEEEIKARFKQAAAKRVAQNLPEGCKEHHDAHDGMSPAARGVDCKSVLDNATVVMHTMTGAVTPVAAATPAGAGGVATGGSVKVRKKASATTPSATTPKAGGIESTRKKHSRNRKKKSASPDNSRKKRSTSEDSSDFIPSCYMNVDIPKHYLIDGKDDRKEIQKGVNKLEWGHMADGGGGQVAKAKTPQKSNSRKSGAEKKHGTNDK